MKGIELPINVLVIVAVAVLVLLGLVALYMMVVGPGSVTIQKQNAWNQMCTIVTQQYCTDTTLSASQKFGVESQWTFGELCNDIKGIDPFDRVSCTQACGC